MSGTIGHYLGRDSNSRDEFIEFSYWGLNQWNESVSVDGDPYVYYGLERDGPLSSTTSIACSPSRWAASIGPIIKN